MQVDVQKYIIIGPWIKKDSFFKKAQELGVVEFASLEPKAFEKSSDVETHVEALTVLREMPMAPQVAPLDDFGSSIVLAQHVVERKHELERLREEVRILKKERDRILPFGDFSFRTLHELENEIGRKFQFYFSKNLVEDPDLIFVNSMYGLNYYVSLLKEPRSFEGVIEMKIERTLHTIEDALATNKMKIDEYETELSALAHHKNFLKTGLNASLNHFHLEESKHKVEPYLESGLFAVTGWIPDNKVTFFNTLAEKEGIYFEKVSVEAEDKVPTYLENKGLSRVGEDLISIYDTPSTQDRDPSLWVYVSFGIFFSMIIADAGYGIILLGISLYLFYKFAKKGGLVKRLIVLSTTLAIGSIIWGVVTASFLGIPIPPESKWRSLSLTDWMARKKAVYLLNHPESDTYKTLLQDYPEIKEIKDPKDLLQYHDKEGYVVHKHLVDNILMELVLFIGAIHVILSFIRNLDKNWAGVGWIIFIVGGYLYFPSVLKATSLIHFIFGVPEMAGAKVGLYLIFIGMGIATVLAVIQRKWAGLEEPTKVIQIFADVMSYLRIYALALAGVIMAETFDRIGTQSPIYIGWLIILAGHTVNFGLAIMAGIIHGLRLNFIEWYHYSFEGGGRKFNPLSLKK